MAHGDYTGQQKSVLAQRYAHEQEFAAKNMSLVTTVVSEARQGVVDLFTDDDREALENSQQPEGDDDDGVTTVSQPDPLLQPVKFKARESLETITVGKDRHLTIEEGQTYRAPLWVVRHLDEKNLVWH